MLRLIVRVVLMLLWVIVAVGAGISTIFFLDPSDYPIVKSVVSQKMITFAIAMAGVIMVEVLYAWRFKIDLEQTFNRIELNPMASAIFLGALILGPCLVSAAIFGTL
jgi:hypothetical protein